MFTFPEECKLVQAIAPQTSNGGITADYVSLKNVHKAWILIEMTQAVGHATGVDPIQASAVDGTGAKAFVNTLPIWANEDVAASDTLVRQTDAITYNVAADIKNKQIVIEVDPAKMDKANSFDVLGLTVDDSSQATNIVSATYVLLSRYPQATPPAAITD